MLLDKWLYLHTYCNSCDIPLLRELETLLSCAANISLGLSVEKDFTSWNPKIHEPQNFQSFYISCMLFQNKLK